MLWLIVVLLAFVLAYTTYLRRNPSDPEPRFLGHVPKKKHAVVIGCGVGGICAAKVLSEYFEKVTIIDRDTIDCAHPNPRAGVPQGKQLHGLLARGCAIVDSLFPGLIEQYELHGATKMDVLKEFKMYLDGYSLDDAERVKEGATIYGLGMSRPFTEFHLRRRLLADCQNVTLMQKTRALGLIYDRSTSTVLGVNIKRKPTQDEQAEVGSSAAIIEEMRADFVVCAAGRKNQIKKWLSEIDEILGIDVEYLPEESNFPGLNYVTSTWRPPQGWLENNPNWLNAHIMLPSPTTFDVGMGAMKREHGEFTITAASYGKKSLPTDTAEILELIRPALMKNKNNFFERVANEWQQTSPWAPYRDQKNVLHHFEELGNKWPQNFVALGDVVVTFNPSYSQGMTNAIMHANALRDAFHNHFVKYPVHDFTGLSLKFQRAAAAISHNFWMGVESNDLQWSTTEGKRTWFKNFMGRFQKQVWRVATRNRENMLQFQMMTNGIVGPEKVLLNPSFLFPALLGVMQGYLAELRSN